MRQLRRSGHLASRLDGNPASVEVVRELRLDGSRELRAAPADEPEACGDRRRGRPRQARRSPVRAQISRYVGYKDLDRADRSPLKRWQDANALAREIFKGIIVGRHQGVAGTDSETLAIIAGNSLAAAEAFEKLMDERSARMQASLDKENPPA